MADNKDSVRCKKCAGTGWVAEHAHSPEMMPCPRCQGHGRIPCDPEAWVHTDSIGDR